MAVERVDNETYIKALHIYIIQTAEHVGLDLSFPFVFRIQYLRRRATEAKKRSLVFESPPP